MQAERWQKTSGPQASGHSVSVFWHGDLGLTWAPMRSSMFLWTPWWGAMFVPRLSTLAERACVDLMSPTSSLPSWPCYSLLWSRCGNWEPLQNFQVPWDLCSKSFQEQGIGGIWRGQVWAHRWVEETAATWSRDTDGTNESAELNQRHSGKIIQSYKHLLETKIQLT